MADQKKSIPPACASCTVEIPERICFSDQGRGSKGCPSLTRKDVLKEANKEYEAKAIIGIYNILNPDAIKWI